MFVQDAGNLRVQRFAADGAFRHSWPIAQSCGEPPNWPLGLAAAPDGSILLSVYAYDSGGTRVSTDCMLRYSPTGDLLAQWPIVGESSRGFPPFPRDVAVAADGDVYVAVGDRWIHRYSADGRYKAAHAPEGVVRGRGVTAERGAPPRVAPARWRDTGRRPARMRIRGRARPAEGGDRGAVRRAGSVREAGP